MSGFFFCVCRVDDKMINEVTIMSPTFETVLEQARVLSAADRKRLARILEETNGGERLAENGSDDDAVVAALRSWVDEIETSPDPERRESVRIAERIRKMNDRGYSL